MLAMHYVVSLLLLAGLSVAYSNATRGLERLRRAVAVDRIPNMLGAWTFASILLLPPPLIAVALCVFYAAEWPSRKAVGKGRPVKYLYSLAANIVAAVAASAVFHDFVPILGAVLALVVFTTINISLISIAIIVSRKFYKLKMLRNPRAHTVELATHMIGAALGVAMAWHQPLAVLVLPVLFAAHLVSAHGAVEDSNAFNPETGLWAETDWKFRTSEMIAEGEYVTLIIVDPAGSEKRLVADVVRPCLTEGSLLGEYGDRHVAAAAIAGSIDFGHLAAGRVRNALGRCGTGYTIGVRIAHSEDVSEMLTHALSDLMHERDQDGISAR